MKKLILIAFLSACGESRLGPRGVQVDPITGCADYSELKQKYQLNGRDTLDYLEMILKSEIATCIENI